MSFRPICIVGPTSSGKTALALQLAKQFDGEIVNADASQMYRGLTVGTGKPVGTWENGVFLVEGIRHHAFDVLEPTETCTVTQWKELAQKAVEEIMARGKLPIVVGGTGLYVQSLVDDFVPPAVVPQSDLREKMARMSLQGLQEWLKEVDAKSYGFIDIQNPRRVQRAIEVAVTTGESFVDQQTKGPKALDALQMGIEHVREILYTRIDDAVEEKLKAGWIEEVKKLLEQGVPMDAPAFQAIGYRDVMVHLQNRMTHSALLQTIQQATRHYAKRQVTWFKRDARIHWIADHAEAEKFVQAWME